MKLQIKTLSPIHIGSGEKYNGLSYLTNRGKVLLYDSTKFMENITLKYSERFMQWIEERTAEIEWLEKQKRNERDEQKRKNINKLLKDAQKKLSIKEFIENAIQDVTVKDKFNNNFSYYAEAKTQVYNNIDIEAFIKQNNKPYIPGTEIKGAIRTAIAYYLLKKDIYWNWLKGELENFGRQHREDLQRIAGQRGKLVNDIKKKLVEGVGKIEEKLQNKLLRADGKDDAKYDLLKLLQIGDSELKKPPQCLFVSDLKTLNISRQFATFQELCKKGQTFTCEIRLENLEKNKAVVLDKLGFSEDQKKVVSNVKNILQCCHEFSNRLIDEELTYTHYSNEIKDKLNVIKKENKPDSPVIRIGKNEGYMSLTMGLLVKDKDKTIYDNVLCHATKNTSYTGSFPKTRRVVNLGNNDTDTCGWVKLTKID
ncbi:MAG: type III-A CRISPR-associated RAMP protein Csm5 [Nitrospinota bacterium]